MDINSSLPPVQIHFSKNFPIETRCKTSDDEYAVIEILKVEYGLDACDNGYIVTFFVSGIKSFSMSDDDQECFIKWTLKDYATSAPVDEGFVSTGNIEMGERFNERECVCKNIRPGNYLFTIEYV